MPAHSRRHPPRVVIDTNVLLSALLFKGGALVALRDAWLNAECVPIVSRATAAELLAVLRYPKFTLDQDQQNTLLAEYLPHCETVPEPKARTKLPRCRDEDDQKFLLLAAAGKADALITGDRDLLDLKDAVVFEILTPREFLETIGKPAK